MSQSSFLGCNSDTEQTLYIFITALEQNITSAVSCYKHINKQTSFNLNSVIKINVSFSSETYSCNVFKSFIIVTIVHRS